MTALLSWHDKHDSQLILRDNPDFLYRWHGSKQIYLSTIHIPSIYHIYLSIYHINLSICPFFVLCHITLPHFLLPFGSSRCHLSIKRILIVEQREGLNFQISIPLRTTLRHLGLEATTNTRLLLSGVPGKGVWPNTSNALAIAGQTFNYKIVTWLLNGQHRHLLQSYLTNAP